MYPLLCLAGCTTVTRSLTSEISKKEYKNYTETVSQILVSSDGKQIVVICPAYHYILDMPSKLGEIIDSPLHPKLSAQMQRFDVTPDAKLSGRFTLLLADDAGNDDKQLARSYGFLPEYGGMRSLQLEVKVSGKRYSAGGFTMPSALAKDLNQSYSVNIREELPTGGKAALVLLTPLTVAADGVLTVLAVPLVVLAIPFIPMFIAGAAAGPIGWAGAGR